MIRELRRKFIRICALSALAVLALIFAFIYTLGTMQLNHSLDMLADGIAHGEGPAPPGSRYFVVFTDESGQMQKFETSAETQVTEKEAERCMQNARAGGSDSGWTGDYRYKIYEEGDGEKIVFVDGSMNRDISQKTLLSAGAVLTGSLAVIVALVTLLSHRAVRPIAENYEKQKQFVSDANHELKTPLTLIMTNLEIAQAEQGENEWLQDAQSEGQRMSALIQKLGILTRLDEETYAEKPQELDLSEVARGKAREFSLLAANKGKSLSAEIAPDVCYYGRREAIERLIDILLDNAVKYCDEGGRIKVLLRGGRHPQIMVENSCRQVGEIELDRLFDRFYRSDKARGASGFGLGLPIARGIVKEHRGEITACAKGTEVIAFKVILK